MGHYGPMVEGFVVHAYADVARDRVLAAGRLADGRSFAAACPAPASFLIEEADLEAARAFLPPFESSPSPLVSFGAARPLVLLSFSGLASRKAAAAALGRAGLRSPDADLRPADALLVEAGIRGPVAVSGDSRPGRGVDLVFPEARLDPGPAGLRVPLRIASIDIETDEATRAVRAVSLDVRSAAGDGLFSSVGVVAPRAGFVPPDADGVAFRADEAALLQAFQRDLRAADPDVLTGWNFLDFDYPRLAERFSALGLPFRLGRSTEAARFLEGEGRRSAAAFVPGRQVLDALRAVRSGGERYDDYKLETVARAVLGEGKLVASTGADKLEELDRLWREDPAAFGAYCLRDASLVQDVLERTGLFRLAVERAALTGVSLDKAWTSVASFERVYALGLRARGVAPLPPRASGDVSGAAGGTVLEPRVGLFRSVAVLDFRSLYPTIIRTFNVDPLARARAAAAPGPIVAPNGAEFDRGSGILPALIGDYFAARRAALDAGDETAAYVYKILMNSFYGVLGSDTCRYARTDLAGAITSFARKWLHFSRDFFRGRGFRVLYGDTDSLFVESPLPDGASADDYAAWGADRCAELNAKLAEAVRAEYGTESFLELRFDKAYPRFLIPPVRAEAVPAGAVARGRAKGYAGLLLERGGTSVDVKGMEAARSDSTPLARRFQVELLGLVFRDGTEDDAFAFLRETARSLASGALDGELVYRRRLARPVESYTASTPPHVRVARALGWEGRRGVVEYVWTSAGPAAVADPAPRPDYAHYLETQVLPVARSVAAACGWDAARFSPSALGSQLQLPF